MSLELCSAASVENSNLRRGLVGVGLVVAAISLTVSMNPDQSPDSNE